MDNLSIDITAEKDEPLALALQLIMGKPAARATHYKIVNLKRQCHFYNSVEKGVYDFNRGMEEYVVSDKGVPTLILFWHGEGDAISLPYPMDLPAVQIFVQGWLKVAEYPKQPDHDGSNGKGWRCFTDFWGHVAGHHYAIVGVQPAWAMYGK